MKLTRFPLGIVLALAITAPAFSDANLHFSQIPPGIVSMLSKAGQHPTWSYKDARAGKYAGRQVLIGVYITQIQTQADGTFLIWNNLRWQSPDPGGLVVVHTASSFLREGGQAWFICRWIKNISVTVTNADTGEQHTGDVPYFEADATGINLTR
jgi:hypothetical protein